MQNFNRIHSMFFSRNKHILLPAFFWMGGLLVGILQAANAEDSILSLMRTGIFSGVSIVTLCVARLLPVIISALAFCIAPVLILPIVFYKAASYGYVATCISYAFQNAGWLMRFLVTFSDGCICAVLLWLWIRYMSAFRAAHHYAALISGLCVISICIFDYCVLIPFTVHLAVY